MVSFNRTRAKRNPSSICKCCGEKIVNKNRGSLYCKECWEMIVEIKDILYRKVKRIKKEYPDYKIMVKVEIKKKLRAKQNAIQKKT